uniref:Uncharacterized protein n=1 Tax=viral metagenome TaxID=1070528 RepID=A0A6C0KIC1_9ZZZZ
MEWKWTKGENMEKTMRVKKDHPIEIKNDNFKKDNRQDSNDRLMNRGMMIQTSINPYLSNNNYLNDVKVQDEFLRPKDSNLKENE